MLLIKHCKFRVIRFRIDAEQVSVRCNFDTTDIDDIVTVNKLGFLGSGVEEIQAVRVGLAIVEQVKHFIVRSECDRRDRSLFAVIGAEQVPPLAFAPMNDGCVLVVGIRRYCETNGALVVGNDLCAASRRSRYFRQPA